MSNGTLLVATVGQAVIRSADQGRSWHRLGLGQPLEFDAITRSLSLSPQAPEVIYAGADVGLIVSRDVGNSWTRVESPFNGQTVWKVAVDPQDPQRIFVGTGAPSRAVLWRSLDAGASWYRAPVEIPEFCGGVNRPRLLAFAYDPTDRQQVWFGLEEGGLFHSRDGGDTFTRVDDRLLWDYHSDIHNIQVLPNHGRKVIVVACVNAVYRSVDEGLTWEGTLAREAFGLYYVRAERPAGQPGHALPEHLRRHAGHHQQDPGLPRLRGELGGPAPTAAAQLLRLGHRLRPVQPASHRGRDQVRPPVHLGERRRWLAEAVARLQRDRRRALDPGGGRHPSGAPVHRHPDHRHPALRRPP